MTPSSTPGPPGPPSPPCVQQKLLVSRGKLPQSVCAAVYVEDHKPGAVVPAADAVCVTVSAASANTLSVITMCRTRTSIPPLHGPRERRPHPRDSAQGAAPRPCAHSRTTSLSLVNRPNRYRSTRPGGQTLSRSAVWRAWNLRARSGHEDMGAQPYSLLSTLVPATASTDTTPPTSTITSPAAGAAAPFGRISVLSDSLFGLQDFSAV